MHSDQIKSQTSSILQNLEKKISKYLSPSYQTSDIFDKSKAIIKTHEQVIQNNKQFLKKNQDREFTKLQQQNGGNQFDQLLHRRRKCQAKLHQMLFDHQIQESLRIQFSPNKNPPQKTTLRPSFNDFVSISSLKQVRSQPLLPNPSEPNFLRIENQLHNMQRKLEKLSKKVSKASSSKKSKSSKNIQNSKISEFSKEKKSIEKSKQNLHNIKSQENLPLKCRSCSSKKESSIQIGKKSLNKESSKKNKLNRENSQQIVNRHANCKIATDQTSLFAKLPCSKVHNKSQTNLKDSKLKKVGLKKFNQNSKKTLQLAKCHNTNKPLKSPADNSFGTSNKCLIPKSHNHIKIKLLQCQSEQVL